MVLGYYMAFMPVYIEKVEIWLAGRKNKRARKDRATQPMHGPWTAEMSNWLSFTNDDKMLSECVYDIIIDRLNAEYGTYEKIRIATIMSHINRV